MEIHGTRHEDYALQCQVVAEDLNQCEKRVEYGGWPEKEIK